MVDRVWNITKMIRGITNLADPNVEILAGWVRAKEELVSTVRLTGQTVPGYTVTASGDLVTDKTFVYNRSPWTPRVSDTYPTTTKGRLVEDASSILDLLTLTYFRLTS
jgi:hypothetical protein